MSYDLAVWYEPATIDSQSAQGKYEAICSGISLPAQHESVSQFIETVTREYPQIDDWDAEEIDKCPWSCEFDESTWRHCILNIRWGMESELVVKLIHLAVELGLTCYDPQSNAVHSPFQSA